MYGKNLFFLRHSGKKTLDINYFNNFSDRKNYEWTEEKNSPSRR